VKSGIFRWVLIDPFSLREKVRAYPRKSGGMRAINIHGMSFSSSLTSTLSGKDERSECRYKDLLDGDD